LAYLEDELIEKLMSEGASMVGFADISEFPAEARRHMDSALWIGVALDPNVVKDLPKGPTKFYEMEYRAKNALLDKLGRSAAVTLRSHAFQAIPRLATDEDIDWIDLTTPLPHKSVATRAGMGWIGKCGLLVTREFGSAIRMSVVLTDAYFDGGTPIGMSYCGDCEECVDKCPAKAPLGFDWTKRVAREDFYDAHLCHDRIQAFAKERGLSSKICGICIGVCPWTVKYVNRALRDR
jgi:epoxyqueuosine reductase QueG